jgi:hypothetical protein
VTYTPEWEPIAAALKRLVDTGMARNEAKRDLCRAIADRKISVRVHFAADPYRHLPEEELSGADLTIPSRLSPKDIDWRSSRPLGSWGSVSKRPSEPVTLFAARAGRLVDRKIEVIEVRTLDVSNLFCGPSNQVDVNPPRDLPERRLAAGAKARGVKQAIEALWPDGVPDGLSAKDRDNKVVEWLRAKNLSVPANPGRMIQRVLKQLQRN